jgi:hypothetical protein
MLLILLAAAASALLVVRLAVTIHADGYGSTPPPRSHEDEEHAHTPRGRPYF